MQDARADNRHPHHAIQNYGIIFADRLPPVFSGIGILIFTLWSVKKHRMSDIFRNVFADRSRFDV